MAIRKDANTLTSSERTELVNAILQLKAEGVYDNFVLRHANANMMAIHRCPAFLPWHRRFLWDYEKELQRVSGNDDLGLPYWNWPSGGMGASIWDDNLLGGDGNASGTVTSGPFRDGQWAVVNSSGNASGPLQRRLGRGTNQNLPTIPELQQLLLATPFDSSPWNTTSNPSFRNLLEGWISSGPAYHNLGHVWVGGSMLPMTSPNDPVFFMHHCMVDKMWHEWQLRFPNQGYLPVSGGPFGQNLNEQMSDTPVASIGSRPIDVLDSTAIGISYDQLLPGTPNPEPVTPPPSLGTNLTIDADPTSGQISAGGELDVYRFEVSSFAEYEIETAGSSDTFITLAGPNDPLNEVARNDDGGDNLNSKITLNLSAGVYHVSVRLYDPSTTGNYTIKVSSVSSTSHIPEITVDAPATAAAISVRSESDVYRFRVVRRAYHTIETSGITDTFLTLSGPDDESILIQEDDDSGSRFNSRIRQLLNAGEYYVRVRHFSPDATGSYSVSVLKR
jgi:tyrosinase